MTISINWLTRVISVPKVDMTEITSVLYELNVNTFRLALKNLEDDDVGMAFPLTHNHNPPVTVGGVTLARVVEVINGYTVTFEDGQYTVKAVGANHNIADVKNANQVSLVTQNSAGLIVTVAGSGVTQQDKDDIAALVTGSPKTLTVGKFLGLK